MAIHALSRLDPNNWHKTTVTQPDATVETVYQYVSPEAEERHLAELEQISLDRFSDSNVQTAISLALEDPSRSSPKFLATALEWARGAAITSTNQDTHDDKMRYQAVISAAMIVMRDGGTAIQTQPKAWARGIFTLALQAEDDPVYRFRAGLQFNPVAIAFVGMVYLLKERIDSSDLRAILEASTREDPAGAHGFAATAAVLNAIDERLPRTVLRSAFAGCIRPSRAWDSSEEEISAGSKRQRQRVREAVDAELAWLSNECPEPEWPPFPPLSPRHRRHLRIPGEGCQTDTEEGPNVRSDEYVDHQAAGTWLGRARELSNVTEHPWLRDIAQNYSDWTATANGSALDAHEDTTDHLGEWNDAYFDLLAHCLPGLSQSEVDLLALAPICSLPDRRFYDVVTCFLRGVDTVYFNTPGFEESIAIKIRSKLADQLMKTYGWRRVAEDRSYSIEMHIGPAIAVLFFNEYHAFGQSVKCYLLPKGIN